jgi:hypothetical protein
MSPNIFSTGDQWSLFAPNKPSDGRRFRAPSTSGTGCFFDVTGGCFVGNYTDARVAERLGV